MSHSHNSCSVPGLSLIAACQTSLQEGYHFCWEAAVVHQDPLIDLQRLKILLSDLERVQEEQVLLAGQVQTQSLQQSSQGSLQPDHRLWLGSLSLGPAYPKGGVVAICPCEQADCDSSHSLVSFATQHCKRHRLPVEALCGVQIHLMNAHAPISPDAAVNGPCLAAACCSTPNQAAGADLLPPCLQTAL